MAIHSNYMDAFESIIIHPVKKMFQLKNLIILRDILHVDI